MSRDVLLDQAAQLISDARVACLKLAISPEDIAKIMMDEAVLARRDDCRLESWRLSRQLRGAEPEHVWDHHAG